MLIVWFLSIKSSPNLLFGVLCLPGDQSHPFAQPTITLLRVASAGLVYWVVQFFLLGTKALILGLTRAAARAECGHAGQAGDGSPEPGQFPIPDHHSGLLPKDVLAGGNVCWTLGAGQGRLRGIRSETYFQFTKQITCIFPIPKNAQTTAQLHSFHTLVK